MQREINDGSATEQRDLRSGTCVWSAYPSLTVPGAPLKASGKVDVVIVGGGITGALVANAVSAHGLSTLVIDRRSPGCGSTAASTALIQFEIDTPLVELADTLGIKRASRAWKASFWAVAVLRDLVRSEGIDCNFRPRQSLYLPGNTLDAKGLAEEARLRGAIGLPSTFISKARLQEIAGIDRPAAIVSDGVADINPLRLTRALLRRAAERNCRIVSPAEIAEVAPSPRKVAMVTSDGVEIEAKALVFATGYELPRGVPADGHRRTSTWAFATRPQPDAIWNRGELIWEAAQPYLYLRTTADGRVIVGGEDEDLDDEDRRDRLLPQKIDALQRKTRALLPSIDTAAEYAWAGTFGESACGLPTIGALPRMPNCYAVLGYGGNGITFAVLASRILSDLIRGRSSPAADLFAFGA